MTAMRACPVCATPTPPERISNEPWCCSLACYRHFHGLKEPESPLRHDAVTMTCPVCQHTFVPNGRQKFCSDACRAAAYRRRRDAGHPPVVVPAARPRRPITIYECDGCGARALGQQRCDQCSTFMRRIGIGGTCPSCDEPIAITQLLDQEVMTSPP